MYLLEFSVTAQGALLEMIERSLKFLDHTVIYPFIKGIPKPILII